MAKSLSNTESTNILGVAGQNVHNGNIRADEFLRELKGREAVKKFREMRDNDSTIGAVMYAVEQMLRDVEINVKAADDSEASKKEKEFVRRESMLLQSIEIQSLEIDRTKADFDAKQEKRKKKHKQHITILGGIGGILILGLIVAMLVFALRGSKEAEVTKEIVQCTLSSEVGRIMPFTPQEI